MADEVSKTSILGSVRDAMGLGIEDDSFDSELLMHINAALLTLNQNGVGKTTIVKDADADWESFKDPEQEEGNKLFDMVPLFVFLRTKILFDPPPPSNVKYMDDAVNEALWRLREEYDFTEREESPNDKH